MSQRCDDCGEEYELIWAAPRELWDEFAGDPGMLCPQCFNNRAKRAGHVLRWTCEDLGVIGGFKPRGGS